MRIGYRPACFLRSTAAQRRRKGGLGEKPSQTAKSCRFQPDVVARACLWRSI